MFSSDQMNLIMKKAMAQLGMDAPEEDKQNKGKDDKDKGGKRPKLTTAQILVIIGLIGNVLDVDSVLVDKDQTIQIVLQGSLKQKTQLEKVMDQVGRMPFDDVVKSIIDRL